MSRRSMKVPHSVIYALYTSECIFRFVDNQRGAGLLSTRLLDEHLPPMTSLSCDPSLQRLVDTLVADSDGGMSELRRLRGEKEAELLSSVVEEYGLEEHGSQLPPAVFDASGLDEEDFVPSLMALIDPQTT